MLKFEWARQFGSSEGEFGNGNYTDHGLVIDRSGNIFITGTTFGDIDGDGDPLINGRNESNPSIWLAKYGNNGSRIFLKEFETTSRDDAYGIAVAPDSSIYISGGSVDTRNTWPAWFSRFDTNGNSVGRVNIDFTVRDEDARDIAVSSFGDVYLAGTDPTNRSGAWVAKYSGGTQQWVKRFHQDDHGITSDDVANSIAVDSQNNAVAVGWTNGSLKGPALDSNSNDDDAWVAKYSSNGLEIWKKQIGTDGSEKAFGVATDSSNNIFVTGYTDGQFAGGRAGGSDAFIVKYSSSGRELWRRQLGVNDGVKADDNEFVYDIDTDNSGNVYLIGKTWSDLDVVGNIAPRDSAERSGYDAFIAKYNGDGLLQWANRIENTTSANGIDIDDDGNIYLSGPTHNSNGFIAPNAGEGSDVWVAKFSQIENSGSDFNNDFRPDIVWRNNLDGTNVIWEMDDTRILQGRLLPTLGTEWKLEATADFNNDGQSDLLWRNTNSGGNVIWHMNGTNIVGAIGLPSLGMEWELGTTGDFNNDGQEDLLWRHSTAGINLVWYLNQGQFQDAQTLQSLSSEWYLATSGDFNNDGNEDLVWRHSGNGNNVFWYTDGNLNLIGGEVFHPLPDMNWHITGSADMDRDGHDDLLWRNSQSGDNVIWHMHNNAIRDGSLFSTLPGSHWQMVV